MTSRKLAIHVGSWILFIAYEVGVSWYFGDHSSVLEFASFYLIDIILFYLNAHFVFNRHTPPKSFSGFILLMVAILGELALYTFLSGALNNAFKPIAGIEIFTSIPFSVVVMSIWRGIYFLGLSIAYWAVSRTIKVVKAAQKAELLKLKSLREKERLENEIIKLQNAYLEARINPHFLFNTLNFIFNQVEEGNPDASKNILLLSEIMHYSLRSLETDGKVPLSREIDHIKRYIELNKSRFDNKLYLKEQIEEVSSGDIRVPPLLLLTFVENVFKHGDLTDKAAPGLIRIAFEDDQLLLYTKNKKNKSRNDQREHLGIINASRRLKNYYASDDVDLKIEETENEFILSLKIQTWK